MASHNIDDFDLTYSLDQSWTVDDLFIEIRNQSTSVHILPEDVLTYEVLWEDDDVHGVLSFTDYYDIAKTHKLYLGGELEVSFTSQRGSDSLPEAPFSRTFKITNVRVIPDDSPIMEIEFEEMSVINSKQMYGSEVFDGKPAEHISQLAKAIGFNDVIVAGPKILEEIPHTIITPAHKPIGEVLGGMLQEHGYKMIIDKLGSYIVHKENLSDDKLDHTGEVFYYQPVKYWIRNQVIEYSLPDGFNFKAIQDSVATDTTQINYQQAQLDNSNLKATPLIPQVSNTLQGVPVKQLPKSAGQRQGGSTGSESIVEYQDKLNKLQTMRIWVPGWNGNRQGKKITVEMPVPKYVNQNNPDTTISGDWVVYKTRDKIISSYFVQELFLRRAGG